MSICTNGHPLHEGDRFCADCGASPAPERACASGHPMEQSDRFCQECGQPAVETAADPEPPAPPVDHTVEAASAPGPDSAPTPSPTPPVAPEPQRKRRHGPLILVSALVVALAAVLVALLITRDSGEPTRTVALDPARETTSTRAPTTTRTVPPPTTAVIDPREVFVGDLDVVLIRSSESRGQLSDALAALNDCVDPAPVAAQIRQIEGARSQEIDQVTQLDPPDAETQALVGTLMTALTNSRDSDGVYYRLVTGMEQCLPIGAGASAAEATDLAASEAKRDFVAAYNPIAAGYGLKSDWNEDQI